MQPKSTRLLTLFVVSSFASLVVISIAIFFGIRTLYRDNVIEIAQQQSIGIAQALLAREGAMFANGGVDLAKDLTVPTTLFEHLDRRMHDYLLPLGIVKIKLFNKDADIIYSTDASIVGKHDEDNARLKAALRGEVDTALTTKERLVDLAEEERIDVDVGETYVPVENLAGEIIGCLELYVDVTRYRDRLHEILASSMSFISTVLLFSFGALFLIMRRETSRLGEYEHQLHSLAVTDELTGIANRRFLLDRAQKEFVRVQREKGQVHHAANLGCIVVDVDKFKAINDRHGHQVGDFVLREISDRMQQAIRQYDLVGRYGGEEFLILMPNCEADQVAEVADRVWMAVRGQPVRVNDLELVVTVSVGFAYLQEGDRAIEDVIRRADDGLYKAKSAGRDQVAYSGPT